MEKESKKDIMFNRMKEKKKEVKIVRRIVLVIVLIVLIVGGIAGYSWIHICQKRIATSRQKCRRHHSCKCRNWVESRFDSNVT